MMNRVKFQGKVPIGISNKESLVNHLNMVCFSEIVKLK